MFFLWLSVLSSTIIAITFKLQSKLGIKLFPVIIINYFVASSLGVILSDTNFSFSQIIGSNWILSALLVGVLLIAGFYLIGFSTQKIGIAVTTVSNKMSVIIPMLFSVFYYSEHVSKVKLIGIFLALVAVFLSVYKKRKTEFDLKFLYLPVLLFFTIGVIDSSVKFAQGRLLENEISLFTSITFGLSGIIGIVISFFNSSKFADFIIFKTILTGFVIGAANFGSMYFIIIALNKSGLDSSVVFGINNISIILLSVMVAFFVFKEKLSKVNWLGIFFSIVSIILLMFFA